MAKPLLVSERCTATIHGGAQCIRAATEGGLCRQHARMAGAEAPCGLCGDRSEGGVTVPITIPGEGNIEDRRLCLRCACRAYDVLAGDGVNEPEWIGRL